MLVNNEQLLILTNLKQFTSNLYHQFVLQRLKKFIYTIKLILSIIMKNKQQNNLNKF